MFAMITTDEYKELLEAEQMCKEYRADFIQCADELKEVRDKLDNLLLCITQGETNSRWEDGKFMEYDLALKEDIAKHINENFMKNGRLTVKENNND